MTDRHHTDAELESALEIAEHGHHPDSVKVYLWVFLALMVLLVVTVSVAFVHLGALNPIVAMTIAVVKATLVILYFMHVRHSSRITWVFAGSGFFFLAILLVFTVSDVWSRSHLEEGLTHMAPLPRPVELLRVDEGPMQQEGQSQPQQAIGH